MRDAPKPTCPKCGRKEAKCVSVEPVFAREDRERRSPVARILAFKCACGHEFIEKVKERVF